MSSHCEHGIQAGIPCGYCIRDARIAALEARLAEEARVRGIMREAGDRAANLLEADHQTSSEEMCVGCEVLADLRRALAAAGALDKERG